MSEYKIYRKNSLGNLVEVTERIEVHEFIVEITVGRKGTWYEKKVGKLYSVDVEQEYPTNEWHVDDCRFDTLWRLIHEDDCRIIKAYEYAEDCVREYTYKYDEAEEVEIWKDIEGYVGIYQVSSFGNVRGLDRISIVGNSHITKFIKGRVLKPKVVNGYLMVNLNRNGIKKTKSIHKLVYLAFNKHLRRK